MPFAIAFVILVVLIALVNGKSFGVKRRVGLYLSIFALVVNTIFSIIFYLRGEIDLFFPQVLPLWYCGLIAPVAIYGFLKVNNIAFAYVYLAAMTPNLIACITPELLYSFPHVEYLAYFFTHAMNMIIALYLVLVFPFSISFREYIKLVLIAYLIIFVSHGVNMLFGTNFNYTAFKPSTLTMLDSFGEWPYYLFYAQFIGLLTTFISYLALKLKPKM